jgi:hypothetical protein
MVIDTPALIAILLDEPERRSLEHRVRGGCETMTRLNDERLTAIVGELASKPGHDKVKAAIQDLLADGLGAERNHVRFEQRVPEAQGRIDAILGCTAFEVKSDLIREIGDAEAQLARYLPERESATKNRFVGITTDGLDWRAYEWRDGKLIELRRFRADATIPHTLLVWLDSAAAIRAELPTDALTLTNELGPESVARAEADLCAIWGRVASKPSVALKRRLWQQLLRLVYGKDVEDEALWLQHTYLVIVAKAIAARVLGFDVDDPVDLLSGRRFIAMGVVGAVEGDFFGWVLDDQAGRDLVVRLSRHVARFRLTASASITRLTGWPRKWYVPRSISHSISACSTPPAVRVPSCSMQCAAILRRPARQESIGQSWQRMPALASPAWIFILSRPLLHV